MALITKAIKGTKDVLPKDVHKTNISRLLRLISLQSLDIKK